MSLTLLDPGPFALFVAASRPRWRSLGVPVGGPSDRAALALGNALVGNSPHCPAVEFTLSGPTLEARDPTACVVFGAPFQLDLNGRQVAAGTTIALESGDRLRIGGTATGARGYLCVAGGFAAPEILGSRSGLKPLVAGTVLICRPSTCDPRGLPFVNLFESELDPARTPLKSVKTIRVVDGPQSDWFADDGFFTQSFTVSSTGNRMGLRMTGIPLARRTGELASEAVAPGAVQVANDGLPIVLGVDGQTIGGYPKVAHVVRADLDLLAQLRPGGQVQFARIEREEAEAAARGRSNSLRQWLVRLGAADRCPLLLG